MGSAPTTTSYPTKPSRATLMLKVNHPIGAKDAGSFHGVSLSPHQFISNAMYMPSKAGLKKFSFDGRRYLHAICNTPAKRLLLQCARQVEKCNKSSTLVSMGDGRLLTIGDITVGDIVSSMQSDGVTIANRVVLWKSEKLNKECVRITTRQGHITEAAVTHPMRTWDSWTAAGSISVGDRLGVVRRSGEFSDDAVPDRDIKFVAYMLGDGHCGGPQTSPSFTQDIRNTLVVSEFRSVATITREYCRTANNLQMYMSKKRGTDDWSRLVYYGLANKLSGEKRVPDQVWGVSRAKTALFLNRLWATDGHVKKNSGSKYSLEYCSISEGLVKDVRALLWKFGIPSTIRKNWPSYWKRQGIEKYAFILRVETQPGVYTFLDEIGALGKSEGVPLPDSNENNNRDTVPRNGVEPMIRSICATWDNKPDLDRTFGLRERPGYDVSVGKLRKYVEVFRTAPVDQALVDGLEKLCTSDLYWDRVISVEMIGSHDCYDIEVADTHTFVADGFVTHNSTSLGNSILTYSMLRENFRSLFVSPSQQQTETFSRDRISTPIELSPILKPMAVFGSATKDNVLYKKFSTGSDITLRYAFLHADRIRGISADLLALDEIQDIITDIIPVIEESLSHSEYGIYRYSGTPKSTDNTISFYWERFSTQNEWVIPCDCLGGKFRHWNVISERSLGKDHLICDRCGKQIFPNHPDAQWASMNPNPNTSMPFEGYRIPQPIAAWIDWPTVISKYERYTKQKFYNEVLGLGYDSGERPLVLGDVEKCCTGPSMNPEIPLWPSTHYFFGIDWGSGENSYTVLTVGAYLGGKFRVVYMHRFDGPEADPDTQIELIRFLYRHFKPTIIGTDYGGGFDRNKTLVRTYGRKKIVEYQYVPSNSKIRYNPDLCRFMVNRTEIMMDIFGAIKRADVFEFPPYAEFKTPFAEDMVSNFTEYNEYRSMMVLNKQPGVTDDGLHSLIYCFLASMVIHPRPDIIAPDGDS